MDKKKFFIFVAHGIRLIGGMEMVTAGMAKYLENLGWKVYILSPEPSQDRTTIPSLNPYLKIGGDCTFLLMPTYKFKRYEQEQALNFMIQKLNLPDINDCEIIISSCSSPRSFWAELLAEKLKARHFFIVSEESYRGGAEQYYEENLDFYYFKWKRNELIYSEKKMLKELFNGYKNVTEPLYEMPKVVREQDAVQDVDFPIDKVQKLDWNICHIGRIGKDFVPYAIEGVAELARRHPDKKINFMFVGDIMARKNFIAQTFKNISNVLITMLGDMVPIPRILFSKIDVVCAMAGSASHTVHEGKKLIVGNNNNPEKTAGVLGYDTKETIYVNTAEYTWAEALENVLVKHLYDNREIDFPKMKPADWYYNNFWTILKNASPVKEYYVQRLSQERIRNWTAIFPFATIAKGARIILFGVTEIARDYKKQIQSQANSQTEYGADYTKKLSPKPYCTIAATVDEHPENFDDSVVGLERLKQKDYDVIIICTFPQQAQNAANKIMQIVPDMADRIVYNFQVLQT